MSYKNLEIWQLAREVAIEIHKMSLEQLPKFEQFESGQQIRRSSKSTRSTIVEGYGRRTYQAEYFKFLTYAIASNDETIDHLLEADPITWHNLASCKLPIASFILETF